MMKYYKKCNMKRYNSTSERKETTEGEEPPEEAQELFENMKSTFGEEGCVWYHFKNVRKIVPWWDGYHFLVEEDPPEQKNKKSKQKED